MVCIVGTVKDHSSSNKSRFSNRNYQSSQIKIWWNWQFVWKHKRSWTAKETLRKKNRAREINLPEFRLYYKASHQGILYWHKNRHTDEGNKIESPEINPHMGTLALTKEARIYNREKTVSSISGAEKAGQLHRKGWN